MKKKAYTTPEQRIVALQHQQDLLIGSVQTNGLPLEDQFIFTDEPIIPGGMEIR
jgi:hypothetical protein